MAEWIGHWNEDQKVLGTISTADHVKCRADFSFHAASFHPPDGRKKAVL